MLKIHYNNRTLCGVNLPQMSSQNSFYYYSEICYLFFYCMVFLKHVHISVLSFCLFVGLFVAFFCIFFTEYVGLLSLFLIIRISALLVTVKSNSNDGEEGKSREMTIHDTNSQCDKNMLGKLPMGIHPSLVLVNQIK